MTFEKRRPVRSAFSSTAGGFVAAVTSPRADAIAGASNHTRPANAAAPATDVPHQPERQSQGF